MASSPLSIPHSTVNAPAQSHVGAGRILGMYATALGLTVAIDAIWLGLVAKGFYPRHIGHLLGDEVQWGAAVLFYLVYVAGIVTFVVLPAIDSGGASRVAMRGAFFGFVAYATYDLTNQATMRDWPVLVTVVDLVWGSFLTAAVSYLTYRWSGLKR